MKKITIFLFILIAITTITNAQIPNNGFELWTSFGTYENPNNGWVTNNSFSAGTYFPVTKSTDHYPATVGSFSIRMENNISFPGSTAEKYGYTATAIYPGYTGPFFQITGHPNSICGYYKFLPLNNDTMTITAVLYYSGSPVSTAVYTSTATASAWTSFNIPFSMYTTADSAQLGFSAFYSSLGGSFPSGPYGNSILYVDNLSFDNLISFISESKGKNPSFNFYPNPANENITLNIDNMGNDDLTLNIYNVIGESVRSELLKQNQQQISTENLSTGIYIIEVKSKEWTERQKLIIQK
jgi:hypothetical protein